MTKVVDFLALFQSVPYPLLPKPIYPQKQANGLFAYVGQGTQGVYTDIVQSPSTLTAASGFALSLTDCAMPTTTQGAGPGGVNLYFEDGGASSPTLAVVCTYDFEKSGDPLVISAGFGSNAEAAFGGTPLSDSAVFTGQEEVVVQPDGAGNLNVTIINAATLHLAAGFTPFRIPKGDFSLSGMTPAIDFLAFAHSTVAPNLAGVKVEVF